MIILQTMQLKTEHSSSTTDAKTVTEDRKEKDLICTKEVEFKPETKEENKVQCVLILCITC